jgi:hypothetical protein
LICRTNWIAYGGILSGPWKNEAETAEGDDPDPLAQAMNGLNLASCVK